MNKPRLKKVLLIFVTVVLVFAIPVGVTYMFAVIRDVTVGDGRKDITIQTESDNMITEAAKLEETLKSEFGTGENLLCTGFELWYIYDEENGYSVEPIDRFYFWDPDIKTEITCTAGEETIGVRKRENEYGFDSELSPLASNVLEFLGSVDMLEMFGKPDGSRVIIEMNSNSYDEMTDYDHETGKLVLAEDEDFENPAYVFENGELQPIYNSGETDSDFCCLSIHDDVREINFYIPKR